MKYINDTEDVFYIKGSLKRSLNWFESEIFQNKVNKFKNWWKNQLVLTATKKNFIFDQIMNLYQISS
ncbi:hypothetical protein HZS_7883 [Henneguya salminicola]|nr:hypothetical protein HZS_7883 [Henneguya salminicola]